MSQNDSPWRTTAIAKQIGAIRAHGKQPFPRRRRRARLLAVYASLMVLILAAAIAILSIGGAQANPTQSAAAAEKAKTLTFTSTSVLRAPGQTPQAAREEGVINLAQPAYQIRVFAGSGAIGFERRVFPDAVYVRPLRRRGPSPWDAANLKPPAVIAPTAQGSNGVADVLGLLEVLRHAKSKLVGRERRDGTILAHYRATTTLGSYLRSIRQSVPRSLSKAPAQIDVWLDPANRVRLAIRRFTIPAPRPAVLELRSSFGGYGSPVAIGRPPGVQPRGFQALDPVANDPVSANVLRSLEDRSRHPATSAVDRQGG